MWNIEMVAANRIDGMMAPDLLFRRLDGDMVELSLLLPQWQAEALEQAAQARGWTTAQLIRALIRDFTADPH